MSARTTTSCISRPRAEGSRRSALALVAWVALGASFVGCPLPSDEEYSRGGRAAAALDGGLIDVAPVEASTVDASTGDASTGDAAVDNLMAAGSHGTFDDGTCANCGAYQATLAGSAVAHSGSSSCRVCRDQTQSADSFYTIDNTLAQIPVVGAVYRASAWVRRDPSSAASTIDVTLRTRQGRRYLEQYTGDGVTTGDSWKYVETSLTVTKSAEQLDVYVLSPGTECFLIDDLVVWRSE